MTTSEQVSSSAFHLTGAEAATLGKAILILRRVEAAARGEAERTSAKAETAHKALTEYAIVAHVYTADKRAESVYKAER